MSAQLRFTGNWPPRQYLERYPNWTVAWDEEGDEDQDETTLKPCQEQNLIDSETVHTVGDVILADGSKHLALVQVTDCIPKSIDVFQTDDPWRFREMSRGRTWEAFIDIWSPKDQRLPHVSLEDARIFPLRFTSRLPSQRTGKPIQMEIDSDGWCRLLA